MGIPSPKRKHILEFINDFVQRKGYAPSVRDIADGCSISSASVVQYHLNVLECEGHIRRDREISRSIGLIKEKSDIDEVPLLGTIAAGKPIPVPIADTWINTAEEILEIPQYLTGGLDGVYALKVKGTSMIDALVGDGDIVLVQQANTADNGDMVAVWLKDEQEATLKRIYREPERICLKPENPQMEPIYCQPENAEIQGKVIGVMRKLKR